MSQVSLFEQLRTVISPARIEAYRVDGATDLDTIELYVWNTALCEALYPSLQNLEIGLRNRLNDALVNSYEDESWYTDAAIVLHPDARAKVREARQTLADEGKQETPARVISELSFGFWTSLFSAEYHEVIWERPKLLKDAFPHMPKDIRKRSTLAGRFGNARKLRNRVGHHEPIWRRVNLRGEHANILEALGWLDPCLQQVTAALDRFPEVHTAAKRAEIRERLVKVCPVESKLSVLARKAAAALAATETASEN